MLFWILATGLSLAVAALIARAALTASGGAGAAGSDVPVYRAQLAEVDRDLARGTIGPDEAGRLRNEIARRLLAADDARRSAAATRTGGGIAAIVLSLATAAGALALYASLGAPGYGDQPLAERLERARVLRDTRPAQAEVEAQVEQRTPEGVSEEFLTLMERLRTAVKDRPTDLQGLRLLARNEAALGNFRAAHAAQTRLVDLLDEEATAQDWSDLGEMLVFAAGGRVSPEAEDAFSQALRIDPRNGAARYYTGLMMMQTGRPDLAFRLWDRLLREGPPDAPWGPPIRARIAEAAMLAGVDYTPPPPAAAGRGPTREDVEAAEEMTAEDRQTMIEGMVQSLSDRLAAEGGPSEEWARLISALGVLGRLDEARAVRDEALGVFGSSADDLAVIRRAAQAAGLDG